MHNWKHISASVWHQSAGQVGLSGVLLLAALAFTSLLWSPYPPEAISGSILAPPSLRHPLGTNGIGQDVLSQLLSGCRVSLLVALSVSLGSAALGFLVGAAAGYYPKRLGVALMRSVDVLMAIPRLPLIILLAVFLRPLLINVITVLIFLSWPGVARTIRAQVLTLREQDSIRFVRFSGGGFTHILRHHLLQELFPLLLAKSAMAASYAIVAEAGLSFLGLGDPTLKSWGMMIRSALDYPGLLWTSAWIWWLLPPAAMVSLAVFSFTLTGYGLDEALRHQESD
ncbi:MAG: ABC transporter permease [Desulforhabdus sp.]|nr:ABC transporter permease [Desulforhabdus sp.]